MPTTAMKPFGLEQDNRMFIKIGGLTAAEWDTKYINDLPDSSFAYVVSGGKKDDDGKTLPRNMRKLPYKDANGKVDLPHVRNALSRLDQTDGIPDSAKSAIKTKLQKILDDAKSGSLKKADQSDTSDISDTPNTIEILPSGVWDTPYMGQFAMTNDNLQEYLANAASTGCRPLPLPIDYDHGEYRGEAAGWITTLFVAPSSAGDGTNSLWGSVEWTPEAKQSIEDGVYKYFSPEWWPQGYLDQQSGDEFDCVLIGGGIVNKPLFNQLTPITASEIKITGKKVLTANSKAHTLYVLKGNDSMILEELVKKNVADLSDEEKAYLVAHESELDEDAKTKFADVLTADGSNDDDDNSNDDDSDANDDSNDDDSSADDDSADDDADDSKTASVKLTAAEHKQLKKMASEGAEAMAILRGKMASETTAKWLYSADGGKFPLTAHEQLTSFYLSLTATQTKAFEKLVASMPDAKNLMIEHGAVVDENVSGAKEQIEKLASEKMQKDTKLTYEKAIVLVAKEQPALYSQYTDELKPSKG